MEDRPNIMINGVIQPMTDEQWAQFKIDQSQPAPEPEMTEEELLARLEALLA